jgi:PAS domain S-box-containing protein
MRNFLKPAHRLARVNYAPRAASFALTFVVICALFAERGFVAWELAFAALCFLVYPHLAYLRTRIARNSKRAELNNLYADSVLMGVWAAQVHFALWPTVVVLCAIILNNAANGGPGRLFWGVACFAAAAAAWGAALGYPFDPGTGALVRALSVLGILTYVSWVGTILYVQNKVLVRMHHNLRDSERQFHFVSETPGDMVSILDPQGRFLHASSSHAKYFVRTVTDSGSSWLEIVHPEDRNRAAAFLQRLVRTRTRQSVQLRMNPGEGPPRLVDCHGSPINDHAGTTTAVVMITQHAESNVVRLARR